MMNFFDAFTLARTKLRSHRVRTGVTVGIAGLLFGLIATVIILTQGIFSSVDRYSGVGLNDRAILNIASAPWSSFNPYEHLNDKDFIREVEEIYEADVANKRAQAKKYSVDYDPAVEDPSPIIVDPDTKEKSISGDWVESSAVLKASLNRRSKEKPFSISEYIKPYKTAKQRGGFNRIQPSDGALFYMKNDEEDQQVPSSPVDEYLLGANSGASLTMLDASLAKPFITNPEFDVSKGEIPVILPISDAEKLLDLPKLSKNASSEERRERLSYVRSHVGEITASFCYRSAASRSLLGEALAQQEMLKKVSLSEGFVGPSLIYKAPDKDDCQPIEIESDTRTSAEKQAEENRTQFEKAVGIYRGEPVEHKITVRGVGISGSPDITSQFFSLSTLVNGLLSSPLGYQTWVIPADYFDKLPSEAKPEEVFASKAKDDSLTRDAVFESDSYLVEFGDKDEARDLLEKAGIFTGGADEVTAYPFGSNTLVIDEMRGWVEKIIFWALVVVGVIAIIILTGIIGRTISDSRRESAVFRAIGATRLDIASIYGTYVILLSLRIVAFAFLLAFAITLSLDFLFSDTATLGAELAYAAVDNDIQFHLFSLSSVYLPLVAATIMVSALLASIVPIFLGARRNPINDMRDEG